ncbi:hypothetical protein IANJMKHF_00338 [Klebsiella phage CPRSA]|nr:hypothetical protein IANJMKHF_00338 [Klebsiella phage CPRSA]
MKVNVSYESRVNGAQWRKLDSGQVERRLPGSDEWTLAAVLETEIIWQQKTVFCLR